MRKGSRAYKLFELGKEEYAAKAGEYPDPDDPWLAAVAVMLAEATSKPKAKAKPSEKMLYTEKDVLALFPNIEVARHGQLNRAIKQLNKPELADPARLKEWFDNNRAKWLEEKGLPLTYSMLCRKFLEWIEASRSVVGNKSDENERKWV